MPKPELTKKLLADSLKRLTTRKHLDKISVGEITEEAGVNRQTFYYHFKDKQELVCWIFDSETAKLQDSNRNDTLIDEIFEYILSEKGFYANALSSDGQNCLREHIYTITHASMLGKVRTTIGGEGIRREAADVLAVFFANALVGSMAQWAKGGVKADSARYHAVYAPLLEDCLRYAVGKCAAEDESVPQISRDV